MVVESGIIALQLSPEISSLGVSNCWTFNGDINRKKVELCSCPGGWRGVLWIFEFAFIRSHLNPVLGDIFPAYFLKFFFWWSAEAFSSIDRCDSIRGIKVSPSSSFPSKLNWIIAYIGKFPTFYTINLSYPQKQRFSIVYILKYEFFFLWFNKNEFGVS